MNLLRPQELASLPPLSADVAQVQGREEQMRLLWSAVRRGTLEPLPRAVLGRTLVQTGARPRDTRALVETAQKLCQTKIHYLREFPETYQSPSRTLALQYGDCDDLVILLASMLRSCRVPCRAAFAWWTTPDGRDEGHVWTVADLEGTWTPAETVRRVPLGWDPAAYLRSRGYALDYRTVGDPPGAVL